MPQRSRLRTAREVNHQRRMGPENVLAFYRSGDSIGEQIAKYYAQARNLPQSNILEVTITWTEADGVYMEFADFDSLCAQLNAVCTQESKDIMCLLSCGCFPGAVGYATLNRDDGWGFHELLENIALFTQWPSSVICDDGLSDPHSTYPTLHPEYAEAYAPDFQLGDSLAADFFAGRPPGILFNGLWIRQLPLKDSDYGLGAVPDETRRANGNHWCRMPKNRRQFLRDRSSTMLHAGHYGNDGTDTNMTYAHIRLECCPVGEKNPDYADEFAVIKRVIDDSIAAEQENRTEWGNTLLAGGQSIAIAYYLYNDANDMGRNLDDFYWCDMDFDAVESSFFDGDTADNMPGGASRIVPGTGFVENMLSDVFFTVLGYQAYHLAANQIPLNKGQMDFAKGAIYVAGQSFGLSPIPSQDTNWFYSLADFPADFSTDYHADNNGDQRNCLNTYVPFWNRNAHGQTTGWGFTKVGTFRIRRNNTAPPTTATIEVISDNVFELREDAAVVATIDISGKTISEAYDFLAANMPANWDIVPHDGGTMSRGMAALFAGACVVTGALREPGSLSYITSDAMWYHLFESCDCIAEASMKWNPTNGVGGMQTGYSSQFGRGIIGDPLYRPFGYLEEKRLGFA